MNAVWSSVTFHVLLDYHFAIFYLLCPFFVRFSLFCVHPWDETASPSGQIRYCTLNATLRHVAVYGNLLRQHVCSSLQASVQYVSLCMLCAQRSRRRRGQRGVSLLSAPKPFISFKICLLTDEDCGARPSWRSRRRSELRFGDLTLCSLCTTSVDIKTKLSSCVTCDTTVDFWFEETWFSGVFTRLPAEHGCPGWVSFCLESFWHAAELCCWPFGLCARTQMVFFWQQTVLFTEYEVAVFLLSCILHFLFWYALWLRPAFLSVSLISAFLQNTQNIFPHLVVGFLEAGAMFLFLRAPPAGAPSDPDLTGLSAGSGAPAAPGGAQPHPKDGAGVRQAGRSRATSARRAGDENQSLQELGVCLLSVCERDRC